MKKILLTGCLCFTLLGMCASASPILAHCHNGYSSYDAHYYCADANGDSICDSYCDSNGDGICDYFYDDNGDGICDHCPVVQVSTQQVPVYTGGHHGRGRHCR